MVLLVCVSPAAAFNAPDLGHGAQVDYAVSSKWPLSAQFLRGAKGAKRGTGSGRRSPSTNSLEERLQGLLKACMYTPLTLEEH